LKLLVFASKQLAATETRRLGRNRILCRIGRYRPLRFIFEGEYAA